MLILLGVWFTMFQAMGNAGNNWLFSLLCLILVLYNVYCIWSDCHEEANSVE